MIETQASCSDIYEADLKPVTEALKHILKTVQSLKGHEQVNISQARGRVLFESIIAPLNVPPYNNSAVDGYALFAQDLPIKGTQTLVIKGTAYAGKPYQGELQTGECIRIMTGASLPQSLDTVVMQEHVSVRESWIEIDARHQAHQNVRLVGEDIQQGETILLAGKQLTPPDIGLLASLGIAEIKVKRRLKVAIASTGDEIFDLGSQLSASGIYDSNRYSLLAALEHPNIEVIDLGILQDTPEALLKSFNEASLIADVIISSGGVSVGDADYTKTALQSTGHIDFWKIAIKPGRPLAFGHLGDAAFFGLPGNPVAVMVTFYQFVLPALEKMLGISDKPLAPIIKAKALKTIRKRAGRTEIQRGILEKDDKGEWTVKITGKQGSGILRSMSLANAFIVLEHERETVNAGELVNVQPFSGLF